MNAERLHRRILRRETHSPRSTAAIALAVILILVFAWIGTETVLAALGARALLVAPAAGLQATAQLPRALPPAAVIACGAAVAVIGAALVVLGLLPGRRRRHTVPTVRAAAVVDDSVLASYLSHVVAHRSGLDAAQVSSTVGHHSVVVRVRPSSGYPVDRQAVAEAIDDELARLDALPRLRTRIVINADGTVGA